MAADREARGQAVTVERMTEAANAFVASLDVGQRQTAQLSFDEEDERQNWHYTPPRDHGGIALGEMDAPQQEIARRLVASGLSLAAYAKATAIIALESVLGEVERTAGTERFDRDPALYHLSIFGAPGGDSPWGWRFQGHHISLNYTIVGGTLVAPLPTFFGSNPAEIGDERPLAAEEDRARELLAALDVEQRARAVISPVAPADIVMSERPQIVDGALPLSPGQLMGAPEDGAAARPEANEGAPRLDNDQLEAVRYERRPKGLPAAEMDEGQREHLIALMRTYVDRMPEALAAFEWGKLERAGLDGTHFAWAGPEERGQPHYYRLQGPSLLVEYDNTQNNANHIHSVWRDPNNDWGGDLLRQHYRQAHHQAGR